MSKLVTFLKQRFPNLFYTMDDGVIYKTKDDIYFAYEDFLLEIMDPKKDASYIFDLEELHEETIIVARKVDPFKMILDLKTKDLISIREKYEKEDEFEICDFITKQINKRNND